MKNIILGLFTLLIWYLSVGKLVDLQSESILLNLILLPVRVLALTFWPLAGIGLIWIAFQDNRTYK